MSEGKTLWGVWWDWGNGDDDGCWPQDAQGDRYASDDMLKVGEYQAELQLAYPDRVLRVYAIGRDGLPQRAVLATGDERTLWGLWVSDGEHEKWYLDYFGRPCFSYDRRLVAAHAEARKASEAWTFSVREVGDDGRPGYDLPEPLIVVDTGPHPDCTEIDELQPYPSPLGLDSTGARGKK